ncbi:hypothetical protein C900_03350 [Fulvivirga imtechensis AK7]|uniref:Uncharacterized protein n=1 Tax=Fulvivirga imtechensis AK7 TaxID=1237149 RepID=L8JPZ5_9BACT|nr:hypothetical protein C900_03350 [Fulvivirga imtechensis AK7]
MLVAKETKANNKKIKKLLFFITRVITVLLDFNIYFLTTACVILNNDKVFT